MHKIRNKFHFVYLLIDVFCLAVVYYFCYFWRYIPDFWKYIFVPSDWHYLKTIGLSEYTAVFVLWCALTIFSFQRSHLFSTDRSLSIFRETWLVLKALFIAGIPTAAAIFMLKFAVFSRLVFGASWVSAFFLLSLWRICKRIYIRHRIKKKLGLIKVLIVGAGSVAETLINELKKHPYFGFEIAGILSQEKLSNEDFSGLKIIGKYSDIETAIQKYYVDEIFVTSVLSSEELEKFVLTARKFGCSIKTIPEGFEHIYGNFNTYNLGYIHFLEYALKKQHGTELFVKKFFDLAISGVLLIALSPLFALFAALIKLYDTGPVFYISKRVGRKGNVFSFYKFRSMKVDADKLKEELRDKNEVSGPIFKIKKDPRVTGIGAFMRKYSIDELPQLWNVLIGDMSLVGPRPPTLDEVEKYDIWQMRRLEVKPGITCLWQVRGRSELSFYKWVKWDLWYIDNWSFWLDMRILFWTIPAVLKGKGAY
jgi:exopolysaccharide biosynthesis polyprenyl glycosylphosphotransferase